jgi:RNA polymerase subunit RPABC4/transcription elongation factor Spt4
MEITCSRCHQAVPADSCFCPTCGLPQIVYSTDGAELPTETDSSTPAAREPGSVDWKLALRLALLLAAPAGLLSCGYSPFGQLGGIFWIAAASAWVVTLYTRRQRPASITIGSGARIGLLTGILAAWLVLGADGAGIFTERFFLHNGDRIDQAWSVQVDASLKLWDQMAPQLGMNDPAQLKMQRDMELSPEGHAGVILFGETMQGLFFALLAALSGAISARAFARSRRPAQ